MQETYLKALQSVMDTIQLSHYIVPHIIKMALNLHRIDFVLILKLYAQMCIRNKTITWGPEQRKNFLNNAQTMKWRNKINYFEPTIH